MRKLAHIEKVEKIEPIEGADFIEKVTVLGWEVCCKVGDFKEGDLCIYIECDSILPDHPVFEFMRDRKFRVRIIKLRKTVSQGLVMPISILHDFGVQEGWPTIVGDDVTDILKIKKHDPQAQHEAKYKPRPKDVKGITAYLQSFAWFRKLRYKLGFKRVRNFPTFIAKTDEERVQNIPHIFKQWDGTETYITEKLAGMSSTYAIYNCLFRKLNRDNFYVCSRNINLQRENNSEWWEVARKFDIKNKLKKVGKNIGIQGEIVGPGVEGNIYKLKELEFFIYNVVDLDKRKRYNIEDKLLFCETHGFKSVPVINYSFPILETITVKDIVEMSNGKSVLNKDVEREGIVIRDINNDHKSFKCVSPVYDLKSEKRKKEETK